MAITSQSDTQRQGGLPSAEPATHTPGPWRVEVNTSTSYLPNTTKIQPKYKLERLNDRTDIWFEEKEAAANARLISAAPEMLEALERLLNNDGISNRDFARKAIQKARGGQ